jgi:hypothetical protein
VVVVIVPTLSAQRGGDMKRLLWAVTVAVLAAGTTWAEPPASGKERTFLEQEFYLLDQPSLKATPTGTPSRPGAPVSFVSAVGAARRWLLASAAGRLDVTRPRPDVW